MTLPPCSWCQSPIPSGVRRDSLFCSKRCRQAAFRLRVLADRVERVGGPLRLGYADPPYPGLADYYADQASYGGEVDHAELVSRLSDGRYDGWALSTSADALRQVLPLCPEGVRVCSWVKPIGVPEATRGLHSTWEAVIVWPARRLRPGKRDWLYAMPARGGNSDLIGRKPLAFCAWLFGLLGALPGDSLDDLYPGSGVVGNAWRELSRGDGGDTSLRPGRDASPPAARDASLKYLVDASRLQEHDVSRAAVPKL